jgi:hypothetical protein
MNRTEPASNGKPNQAKGKTAERFKVINTFADFCLTGLNRAEIAAWLLLWRDTKPDSTATTSQADLARRAGTSERTMRRAIDRLQRLKLITVVYKGSLRRGPSSYRVNPLASVV